MHLQIETLLYLDDPVLARDFHTGALEILGQVQARP
jgi:hypothetical protein